MQKTPAYSVVATGGDLASRARLCGALLVYAGGLVTGFRKDVRQETFSFRYRSDARMAILRVVVAVTGKRPDNPDKAIFNGATLEILKAKAS